MEIKKENVIAAYNSAKESGTLAEYAGKQFIQLWMDFYLIRK